jgi:lysophospholipase L1-like esterase
MVRVVVAGNSVALHVAPRREGRDSGTYADLLRRRLEPLGGAVVNVARRSNLVDEDDLEFMANCQRNDPDAVILQYGINEAAPRILSRPLWMWLKGPQAYGTAKSLLRRVEGRLEPHLVRWTRAGGWIGPKRFEERLRYKVRIVRKESAAVPMVVNLGPPTPDLERLLPGMTAAVERYNAIMERVCRDEDAVLIDIHALVRERGPEIQPDGIHLTAEGHRCVAELLWDRLCERFPGLPAVVP